MERNEMNPGSSCYPFLNLAFEGRNIVRGVPEQQAFFSVRFIGQGRRRLSLSKPPRVRLMMRDQKERRIRHHRLFFP
jgi:hypothetical protein